MSAIQLNGDGSAIKGVLRPENGGTGSERGLAQGTIFYGLMTEATMANTPYGSLVVLRANMAFNPSTVAGALNVVGVVADVDGIDCFATGPIQTAGVADVLVTGTVHAGDRLRSSATQGTAEVSATGSGQFAIAVCESYGGMVRALLTTCADIPASAIHHGGLTGLGDDDHAQYVLRHEVAIGAIKSAGIVPTNATGTGYGTLYSLDHLTDGDPATVATGGIGACSAGTYYLGAILDFGEPVVLSAMRYLVGKWAQHWDGSTGPYWTGWRVRISDDGATWTTLDSGSIPAVIPGNAHGDLSGVLGHRAAASRYWEWDWVTVVPTSTFGDGPGWYTLDWFDFPTIGHRLFSDVHADIDLTTAPSDGDALLWDSASATWIAGPAGGGGGPFAVGDYPFHDESLTDGASNFIFAAGDIVTVVGIPN